MRKEYKQTVYCNIKDYQDPSKPNSTPRPMFFIGDKKYNTIGGYIMDVSVEHKEITPSTGKNAGKKIKVHNLLVEMVDDDGIMTMQMDLYSQIARSVLNALAGKYGFDKEWFFSVYLNKAGYRTIAIKDRDGTDSNFIDGKYSWEELQGMLETKTEKGEEKKDYDGLTDKLLEDCMPIIEAKINNNTSIEETQEEQKQEISKDDDILF